MDYGVEEWEPLLKDVEGKWQIGLTVHDLYGLLTDDRGEFLLPGRHLHPHRVCQRRETTAFGAPLCVDHCQRRIARLAGENQRPCPN